MVCDAFFDISDISIPLVLSKSFSDVKLSGVGSPGIAYILLMVSATNGSYSWIMLLRNLFKLQIVTAGNGLGLSSIVFVDVVVSFASS